MLGAGYHRYGHVADQHAPLQSLLVMEAFQERAHLVGRLPLRIGDEYGQPLALDGLFVERDLLPTVYVGEAVGYHGERRGALDGGSFHLLRADRGREACRGEEQERAESCFSNHLYTVLCFS